MGLYSQHRDQNSDSVDRGVGGTKPAKIIILDDFACPYVNWSNVILGYSLKKQFFDT